MEVIKIYSIGMLKKKISESTIELLFTLMPTSQNRPVRLVSCFLGVHHIFILTVLAFLVAFFVLTRDVAVAGGRARHSDLEPTTDEQFKL